MKRKTALVAAIALAASLLGLAMPAQAVLAATGATDPGTGFPAWYRDGSGTSLALCLDQGAAAGGRCASALPNPAAAPVVPGNFSTTGEAFYYLAKAVYQAGNVKGVLVMNVTAAFLNGTETSGEQITFTRIQATFTGLVPGATYTVNHPFGTFSGTASATGGLKLRDEVGCGALPCDFTLATRGKLGPFLGWDPAVAPAAPVGFIGDGVTLHSIVPGPNGAAFRVNGPGAGGPASNNASVNQWLVYGKIQAVPEFTASAPGLTYGITKVGTASAAQTETVTNTGTAPLVISSVTVGGTNASEFATTANNCVGTIAVGASCAVSVSFRPAATGARSATLTFVHNAAGGSQVITLDGSGGAPVSAVTPTSIAFATTDVGTTTPSQAITFSNTGDAFMAISSVTVGGLNPGDFTVANGCGTTLAAGASCNLSVSFAPRLAGDRSATINIANDGGAQSVALAGTGVGVAPPPPPPPPPATPGQIAANPTSINFGNQVRNTRGASQTVTITNTGGANVKINTVALGGSAPRNYVITANSCTGTTLASGGFCTVDLAFAPKDNGAPTASLSITSTANAVSVALSGTTTR